MAHLERMVFYARKWLARHIIYLRLFVNVYAPPLSVYQFK